MDTTKMQSLLLQVFKHAHPGYTTYKFASMINIGLVLTNIKPGAIDIIDKKIYNLLRKNGLYVENYSYLNTPNAIFISKSEPKFLEEPINHKKIGYKLGYLTPQNIGVELSYKKKYFANIIIKFKNNNGNILTCTILNQIIIDKSEKSIKAYLKKYINGIEKLKLPNQFKIISISEEIKDQTNK